MEENHSNHPEMTLEEYRQRLTAQEGAFAAAELRAQKYAREQEKSQEELAAREKALFALQDDYESLRLQKGGFGFKALLASGLMATLTGFVLCYLFFRPRDQHAAAFAHFRHETQFNIEYAIGQGDYVHAEEILKGSLEKPDYQTIRSEIEMVYKVVSAAKRERNE